MYLHRTTLSSFRLFRENLGNMRELLGQIALTAPLAKNCAYAYVFIKIK